MSRANRSAACRCLVDVTASNAAYRRAKASPWITRACSIWLASRICSIASRNQALRLWREGCGCWLQQTRGFPFEAQGQADGGTGHAAGQPPPNTLGAPAQRKCQRPGQRGADCPIAAGAGPEGGLGVLEAANRAHGDGLDAVEEFEPGGNRQQGHG